MSDALDLRALFSDLVRFETELWAAVDRRLRAECNLQLAWFEPLQVVAEHGACRVQDISEHLAITVGGASKLVDRIEGAGLCRRRSNPDDRRSSLVALTPAGKEAMRRASKVFETELRTRFTAAVSEKSLRDFAETLGKLRSASWATELSNDR
ncbi:MarR family transcriptional regulator [Mycobacterium sp. CBMA271]|uniref:MarR family winged helix-turn-helix transcriptional regulator n=1 Tax=unclassified Mycobacteroides TaxID=2618759 RepID=UPI0012DCC863|nr:MULTISPECIES: MarR family transcriptional regulator [unclassified Mycobacteroides]MUM18899.1 hypothetical protein [Mycobacteroides sp. CBMA 326]MUM23161.1 MarR family transcriptional regulator [Mycobacteroides sp. CBMA 271]